MQGTAKNPPEDTQNTLRSHRRYRYMSDITWSCGTHCCERFCMNYILWVAHFTKNLSTSCFDSASSCPCTHLMPGLWKAVHSLAMLRIKHEPGLLRLFSTIFLLAAPYEHTYHHVTILSHQSSFSFVFFFLQRQ